MKIVALSALYGKRHGLLVSQHAHIYTIYIYIYVHVYMHIYMYVYSYGCTLTGETCED